MAKINKEEIYTPDTNLSRGDNWVGSDEFTDNTKTYYLGDVTDFVGQELGTGPGQNNLITEKVLGVIDISVTDAFINAVNGLTGYTVGADEIIVFTGEFAENGKLLNTKFVYKLQTGKGTYGVGGTQLTIDDLVLLNPKQPETERNTAYVDSVVRTDKIHSGNIIWREGTMIFDVVGFMFTINGITYIPADTSITLDPASLVVDENRIDVFVVDATTGGVTVLKGNNAATPQEPVISFGEQLYIDSVYIPANATEPQIEPGTDFVIDLITDETDSEPNEWNLVSTPTNVDINDTSTSFKGSKSINFAADASGILGYTKDSLVTYDSKGYLQFGLKLSQPLSEGNLGGSNPNLSIINITLSNSTDLTQRPSKLFVTARNNTLALTPFDNSSTDWQAINIPMARFQYLINNTPAQFDTIEFEMIRCGQLNIDDIKIQVGTTNPVPNIGLISIRDENNVEQFVTNDFIQFQGVTFDAASKKITITGSGSGDMILSAIQTVTGEKIFNANAFAIKNNGNSFKLSFTSNLLADASLNLPSNGGQLIGSVNMASAVSLPIGNNGLLELKGYHHSGNSGSTLISTLGSLIGTQPLVQTNESLNNVTVQGNSIEFKRQDSVSRLIFDWSALTANRTITFPDSDVDLGNLGGGGAVASVFGRVGIVVAATSDYDANQIDFNPYNTITSTNSQAAIEELKDELDAAVIGVGTGATPIKVTFTGGETSWDTGSTITDSHQLVYGDGTGSLVLLQEGVDYTKSGSIYTFLTPVTSTPIENGEVMISYPNVAVPTNYESEIINNYRSYNKAQLYTPNNLTDASVLSWDMINQPNALLLATGAVGNNRTLPNSVISNAITLIGSNALLRGNSFVLTFKQDATGGKSIDFENDYTVVGKFDTSPNAITKIYIIIEDSKALVVLTEFSGVEEPSQVTITTSTNITSETASDNGYALTDKNVLIQNGANNINFTVGATENQVFSVQKEGTGNITFVASGGKTLREVDGTAVLDGVVGSTATVSVVGTIISIRISNAS